MESLERIKFLQEKLAFYTKMRNPYINLVTNQDPNLEICLDLLKMLHECLPPPSQGGVNLTK